MVREGVGRVDRPDDRSTVDFDCPGAPCIFSPVSSAVNTRLPGWRRPTGTEASFSPSSIFPWRWAPLSSTASTPPPSMRSIPGWRAGWGSRSSRTFRPGDGSAFPSIHHVGLERRKAVEKHRAVGLCVSPRREEVKPVPLADVHGKPNEVFLVEHVHAVAGRPRKDVVAALSRAFGVDRIAQAFVDRLDEARC